MLRSILLVEDDPRDVELATIALEKYHMLGKLDHVADGVEAMEYVERRGRYANHPLPEVIILDLKMPRLNGLDVLQQLRQKIGANRIPVVVFSSSKMESDVASAYALGANSYVVKPTAFRDYVKALSDIGHMYGALNEAQDVRSF